MEILLIVICILLILVGMAGVVLPFLPGVPVAWIGLLIYGIYTNFEKVSVAALVIFGILTLLSFVLDFAAPMLGAAGKKTAGSKQAAFGSALGGLFGIFIFGPIGLIVGTLLGAFLGEYIANPDFESARKKAWGAFIGILITTVFKIALVFSMGIYFLFALFK